MKLIYLTNSQDTVKVDDEDYERLSAYNWGAARNRYSVYAQRRDRTRNRMVFMHVELLPGCRRVDHWDGDGLNNQRSNLRPATPSTNAANARKCRRVTSSRFKGVMRRKSGWQGQIMRNGKSYYLGTFNTEVEAALAYDAKARELFGEFAYLNFPKEGENGRHQVSAGDASGQVGRGILQEPEHLHPPRQEGQDVRELAGLCVESTTC